MQNHGEVGTRRLGTKGTLRVHDVGDGTTIDVDGRLTLLAARIGDGTIRAAMLSKLTVNGDKALALQGDFKSDVTIDPGKVLSAAEAKLNLLGTTVITGKVDGATFVVPGNAGAFRVGIFENSNLLIGFTPTDALNPFAGGTWNGDFKLASFKAIGFNGYTGATFVNSHVIAAKLGSATVTNVTTANSGKHFGFAMKAGLLKNRGTIVLTSLATKLLSTQPVPFNSVDFFVQEM